jgi:hypothetical protein
MAKPLSTLLWGLSKSTIEKMDEYRTRGALIQTKALYVKSKVEDFKYDKGITGYKTSYVNIEKEEWHWKDQHDFIQEAVKEIPEYSDCVAEISRRCQVNDQQADFWLSRFVQSVVSAALVGNVDHEFLVDQTTTFISDLDNSPIDWKVEAWLNGIWLEDEQYRLENGIILRRPNPPDLETEISFELLPSWHTTPFYKTPSAILEAAFRTNDPQEVQREIETILDILRLFRLGSVTSLKLKHSSKSFLEPGGTFFSTSEPPETYKYALGANDVELLETFLNKMKPLVPPDPIFATPSERDQKGSPLRIALQRYKDALLHPMPVESRVTSAITCLEALYLKASERMELSHRLAQRTSALLRLLSYRPLQVYNELSRAYEIRSTFIHGSQIERKQQASAAKLCESVLDYARVSLVAFMQHQDTIAKEDLINRLDNSLLDENALHKAQQLFHDSILIPMGTSY